MASTLVAMASNLRAMASNILRLITFDPNAEGLLYVHAVDMLSFRVEIFCFDGFYLSDSSISAMTMSSK